MRPCPYCAEEISESATICPYCRMDVSGGAPPRPGVGAAYAPPPPRTSSSNTWVIVLAVLGGVILLVVPCLIALLLPAVQQAREAARRSQCKNNLKQIGLALHNYHDVYGSFPPAYVADENGEPMYSWRVLILPYLDQQALYDSFDLSQPWDAPPNIDLLDRMPAVFRCPSHGDEEDEGGITHYAGVTGENTIFQGAEPVQIADVTDGTSNTIMVGEVAYAGIAWTAPVDINIEDNPDIGDPDGFSSDHVGGVHFLMTDGAVRFVSENIDSQTLENLYLRNDGNAIGGF